MFVFFPGLIYVRLGIVGGFERFGRFKRFYILDRKGEIMQDWKETQIDRRRKIFDDRNMEEQVEVRREQKDLSMKTIVMVIYIRLAISPL